MNILKQVWYEIRQQPLVTWVTVGGTAISIFLIMVLYMVSQVDTVDAAPEVNRSRTLYAPYIHILKTDGKGNSSGSMSLATARRLYDGLPGVEIYSYGKSYNDNMDVNMKNGSIYSVEVKGVDDNFWKINDFEFISGRPFTVAQVAAAEKRAIVSESMARRLCGNGDILGKEVMISHIPYVINGVVKTTSPLLRQSFADIYIPFEESPSDIWEGHFGDTQVTMLLSDDASVEDIKNEVKRRYEMWDDILRKEGKETVYHRSPLTAEEMASAQGSNNDPSDRQDRRYRWMIYALLLLVPAINLSGMTRSRLGRRVSEIGVRRAYGATRSRIVGELLAENFVLTLAGGVIGLVLSIIFISTFSYLFVDYLGWNDASYGKGSATPAFSMFFTWGMFGMVMLFCFMLNILSTGIPSLKASRVNPAEAMTSRH